MHGRVANDAALPHFALRRLELRLDEGQESAVGREELEHRRQDRGDARERHVAYGQVGARTIAELGNVHNVRALEQGHPLILAQRPVELRPPHVHGQDMGRTAFE
ncbi:Uncharacterised protein [Collinsella intestinalis]|nr:Uncharacterised protein [Collinsella intestinalis]